MTFLEGLPGRGVKELACAQKCAIEESLASGSGIAGFALDLIKAYNTFGRYVVDAWVSNLDKLVRYPTIQGHGSP